MSEKHNCPVCQKAFVNESMMHIHVRERHGEDAMDAPPQTEATENRTHSGSTAKFQCPHCSKKFAGQGWLLKHISKEHGKSSASALELKNKPETQSYDCPYCGRHFSSGNARGGHKKSCPDNPSRQLSKAKKEKPRPIKTETAQGQPPIQKTKGNHLAVARLLRASSMIDGQLNAVFETGEYDTKVLLAARMELGLFMSDNLIPQEAA